MNNKLVKNKCGYVIDFFSPRLLGQIIYIYRDGVGHYGKLSNNKNKTTEKYIYRTQGSVVNRSEGRRKHRPSFQQDGQSNGPNSVSFVCFPSGYFPTTVLRFIIILNNLYGQGGVC